MKHHISPRSAASIFLVLVSLQWNVSSFAFLPLNPQIYNRLQSFTTLHAMGPIARAKKMMDPEDYNRVVNQKMKQEGLTRKQAEEEYNAFLENPSFYYALDKKEEYYKSLGYKDIFEGMIGEAEKEGRGDEVRERIAKFRQTSRIKAYSVLAVFIISFCYLYNLYHDDPTNFLPGLPIREQ